VPYDQLLESLGPINRLALSYAPASSRVQLLGFLALDARLAGIVRNSREPMLAQLRLAWWREQLSGEASRWPEGEPLLVALRSWENRHGALLPLVDGWEAMTGDAPLAQEAFLQLADGRASAFAALVGPAFADEGKRLGRNWALADMSGRLTNPEERATVATLAKAQDWRPGRLPRALRPLVVLHGLAARSLRAGANGVRVSPFSLLAAVRLGLLGR
jgi:15-cis-phytoene synthase